MSLDLGEPDGPLTPRVEYWRTRALGAERAVRQLEMQVRSLRDQNRTLTDDMDTIMGVEREP